MTVDPNNNPESLEIVEWLSEWFIRKINIVTSFSNSLTNTKVPSEKLVKNSLDNKVDKVNGKGLSTNDYDNVAKLKVDSLHDVAISGSYNDLTDKPTTSGNGEIANLDFWFDSNNKEICLSFNEEPPTQP